MGLAPGRRYTDLPAGDSRTQRSDSADTDTTTADTLDAALEADLASFDALHQAHLDAQVPGQLDLTDVLTHERNPRIQIPRPPQQERRAGALPPCRVQ